MKITAAACFAIWNGIVAVASGSVLWLVAPSEVRAAAPWALLGWSIMSLVGVVGGYWIEARHGRPGAGFLGALTACILTRLFASAGGAFAAAARGTDAVWAFLAGLAAAFIPLQLLEITWFMHKARKATSVRGSDAVGS